MDSVEERLRRVEELLRDVLSRLRVIEEQLRVLGLSSEELGIASRLVMAFSIPAVAAIKASERVIEVAREVGVLDPISRAVIEVLSTCEALSTSEITRKVRQLRGVASRRIVRERIEKLVRKGVVVNVGSEARPKYVLKRCLKRG